MKQFLAVFALFAIIAYVSSGPVHIEESLSSNEETHLEDVDFGSEVAADLHLNRQRRFTCDLFSFSSDLVTPNHAACATKCLTKGFKGGHCEGTECICRTDRWIG